MSFLDRATRYEAVQGYSDVVAFSWNGDSVTGRSGWTLDSVTTRQLKNGELRLRLALHSAELGLVKVYLIYPKESIIQEWVEITNRSARPGVLRDPAALEMQLLHRDVAQVDFTSMTGNSRYRFETVPLAGFRQTFKGEGNAEYSPIQSYQNRTTRQAVFVGWDYIARWRSNVGVTAQGAAHIDFRVANHQQTLAPGEGIETPKAFTGVFHGDFDELGHQLLDYQYRYKWDYARAPYFGGTEMEPTWAGSRWANSFNPVTLFRQVFHMADLMREVGADIYWRDHGWWDSEGEWNGPNWGETRRYLSQYGMQQVIYLPIYDADSASRVYHEHPEWIWGRGRVAPQLDQSIPAVIDWELQMLESRQRLWGDFQWRRDWDVPATARFGPKPDLNRGIAQDQGFRRLLTTFLDRNPGMAYHGCNNGADDPGYDHLGMAVSWSMNDGGVNRWRGYYASYLYPPEKLEDLPDAWSPDTYSKEVWRGRLWNKFPTQGDTQDPAEREGIRELIGIYHYLFAQGVFGRWAWVYHPAVTGDSADWYLQRLSGDQRRGVIIPSHAVPTPVTIYPKGLLPELTYHISYQETTATEERSGAALMAQGLTLPNVRPGELIYLNVPLHPGSAADRRPPAAPTQVTQAVTTHMDYSGVAVRWQAATVDGSGNRSPATPAAPVRWPAAVVVDDTSRALQYSGPGWERRTGQWLVAHGTEARSHTPGDAVSYTFEGSRVTWYGRLGPQNGVAAVYLDGVLDRVVDTYDGNQMTNVAVYSRTFPGVERHTLRIEVVAPLPTLQDTVVRVPRGDEPWVVIDGLQVDTDAPNRARGPGGTEVKFATAGGPASSTAGDEVTYKFTGRGITWVGRRCAGCGMADVYLDGVLVTTVDSYVWPVVTEPQLPSDEQRNVPLFTHRWPAAGRHTLRIVVRPDANLWATGHTVHLDGLHTVP